MLGLYTKKLRLTQLIVCGMLIIPAMTESRVWAEITLSAFNGTGFDYTFSGFTQTTGSSFIRIQDTTDSWGGGGINSALDLSTYADGRFTVDMAPGVTNQTDTFTLELIDANSNTGKWTFNVSDLSTSGFTNLVSSTTLANPTSGVNDWQNLDLSNITKWQLLGEYGGTVPFDMFFDNIAVSNTVEAPPAYPGAESDATWRTTAESNIDTYRKGDLSYRVLRCDEPVAGAQVDVQMTEHEFVWGTAVAAWRVNSTTSDNTIYKQKVEEMFNLATLENTLKWPAWEGEWGSNFSQSQAASALSWIEAQGMTARGHVQVWPGYSNLPSTVKAKIDEYNDIGTLTGRKIELENELAQNVIDHINEIATATAGKVDYWDVINEVRANHDLMDILGDEAMVEWFNVAKAADPNAELYLNEYGIIASGGGTNTPSQQEYEGTIQYLIDQNAAIEGIGIQGHFDEGSITGPEQIWTILDRFDDFGLPIHITEFDFNTTDEDLQAQYMTDVMTALFAHPAVEAFIQWGLWEDAHWRSDAALFNSDWTIKPNGQAYLDLVYDAWWTNEQSTSDAIGSGTIRGFKGMHNVTVTHDGVQQRHTGIVISDTATALDLPLADSIDGTLDADVVNLTGSMEVAGKDSLGTLTLQGNFEQLDTGTLNIEMTSGDADLIFAENIALDGDLVIDVIGAAPKIGEVFIVLLSSGSFIGNFDNVICTDLLLNVEYLSNMLRITVLDVLSLPGDLNGDGYVGLDDLDIILTNWNQAIPPANSAADPSDDGFVGLDDLDIVLNNWNTSIPISSYTDIPEPSSLALLVIGTIALQHRRNTTRSIDIREYDCLS